MNASQYLINLITTTPHTSVDDSIKKQLQKYPLNDLIFGKLISRKFRTKKIPSDLEIKIIKVIQDTLKDNKPLHFTVPFGGYKLWKFPTYPGPDFAELFNLIQMRSYLSRICQIYKPGIILEYWSDEIMVSKMNNYPQEDLDTYNDLFEQLINWFGNYLPDNFKIKYNMIRNKISYDEYHRFTDEYINANKPKWKDVPQDQQVLRLKKAERNYKGDLSSLANQEKYELLLNSSLRHDAFIFGDWDKQIPWAFDKYMIPIGFQYTSNWGIPIKSSISSTTQFWVGMGILKIKKGKYFPSILTYQQYISAKENIYFEDVTGIPDRFGELQSVPFLND